MIRKFLQMRLVSRDISQRRSETIQTKIIEAAFLISKHTFTMLMAKRKATRTTPSLCKLSHLMCFKNVAEMWESLPSFLYEEDATHSKGEEIRFKTKKITVPIQ